LTNILIDDIVESELLHDTKVHKMNASLISLILTVLVAIAYVAGKIFLKRCPVCGRYTVLTTSHEVLYEDPQTHWYTRRECWNCGFSRDSELKTMWEK
jgi:hypothetical protein